MLSIWTRLAVPERTEPGGEMETSYLEFFFSIEIVKGAGFAVASVWDWCVLRSR